MGYDDLSPRDDAPGNAAAQAMKSALADLHARRKAGQG